MKLEIQKVSVDVLPFKSFEHVTFIANHIRVDFTISKTRSENFTPFLE